MKNHQILQDIKRVSHSLTIGAALLVAPQITLRADCSWQTLAEFEVALPAAVDALTRDAEGNLYAAVSTSDNEWRGHALIRKSSDWGATWTVVEELTSVAQGAVKFLGLATDPAGQIYAAGYLTDDKGQSRWLVKKGSAGGSSWSTVDDFALAGGQTTIAQGLTVDAHGHLYVAGYGDGPPVEVSSAQRMHWLVRQSRDGGQSWSTIEDFRDGLSARATTILSTAEGLFVAGSARSGIPESGDRWLVRKGTETGAGGFRWETVDDYQMGEVAPGYVSQAHGLGQDREGNLYAVGRSYALTEGSKGTAHWIVRRASSAGMSWAVVDTFQMETGHFAAARAVTAGPQGVYVVGQATGPDLNSHWVVRKSETGALGSWVICDDFQKLLAPPSAATARTAGNSGRTSLQTTAGQYLLGLAILCDGDKVLAAGSARTDTSQALVRRMNAARRPELATASDR